MTTGGDDPYGFELRAASPTRPVRGRLSDGRLYVDLVPTSAWLSNLQAELTGLEWRSCSSLWPPERLINAKFAVLVAGVWNATSAGHLTR